METREHALFLKVDIYRWNMIIVKLCFFKVCVILDDTILRLSSCESILLFCELDISKKNFPKLSKSDGKL